MNLPNSDLPADIQAHYKEAADILPRSPRGAAALLRLSIQKLCAHLGTPGKNINDDIALLVARGLPVRVQQSLDILRVVGNEAVHPGQIDFEDDPQTALELFSLLNLIAENQISEPRRVEESYQRLPEEKRKQIETRDQRALNPPAAS